MLFPTDGNLSGVRFSKENNEENRRAAIAGFLERASQALEPTVVRIAADVFGYVTWRKDDTGIGQVIEEEEIRAQMQAAVDADAEGWMLWDPRVRYTVEAR